eukprot:m.208599 g.208599  ORF g.208599 m.208599 type:complete len:223 (-) comp53935_c0_seq8:214-882(-)
MFTQEDVRQLITAVIFGDMANCQRIVSKCGPGVITAICTVDFGGVTALHQATSSQLEILRWFLQQPIDCNGRDKSMCTPLMYATMHGIADYVQALLDAGANLYIQDKDGATVFDIARCLKPPQQGVLALLEACPSFCMTAHERNVLQQNIKPARRELAEPSAQAEQEQVPTLALLPLDEPLGAPADVTALAVNSARDHAQARFFCHPVVVCHVLFVCRLLFV